MLECNKLEILVRLYFNFISASILLAGLNNNTILGVNKRADYSNDVCDLFLAARLNVNSNQNRYLRKCISS
jgi:hypothetical protein